MIVKYISTTEEYFETDLVQPQPLINVIPEWFRKMKFISAQDEIDETWSDKRIINIKSCPSFIDVFKEGIVLVSPVDIRISYDDVDNMWNWRSPLDIFPNDETNIVTFHNDDQMKNFLPSSAKTRVVFKINLPLLVNVPKGYKVRMLPVPFQYNNDFETVQGIFNPHLQPQVNVLLEYTSNKNNILIKQGTPLAVHIPYKKEKFKIKKELYNPKKHRKLRYENTLLNRGRFHNSYLRNQPHE
jgi:hypothetical protein